MTGTGATEVPDAGEAMENPVNLLISQAFAWQMFGWMENLKLPHLLHNVTHATRINRQSMEFDLVITIT
jgi:hypothetical protein